MNKLKPFFSGRNRCVREKANQILGKVIKFEGNVISFSNVLTFLCKGKMMIAFRKPSSLVVCPLGSLISEKEILDNNLIISFSNKNKKFKKYQKMHCEKSARIWSFSGPYFPTFGLNTERYFVSLRIQSKCGKTLRIRTLFSQ